MNPSRIDFATTPMLVYWETTRACALACRHCRASAEPQAHPLELKHHEAESLLESIASFGNPIPHLVLTGGDPLQRKGLFELIGYAKSLGIRVSTTPAATPDLTWDSMYKIKDAGIESIALSIDGSTPTRHDAIRQVDGCFDCTVQAAKWAGDAGLPLQINTLVCEETRDDLPAILKILEDFPVMRWSLFFLIAIGRGEQLSEVSPETADELMEWVYDLTEKAPFPIKTTEAPSYRRLAHLKMLQTNNGAGESNKAAVRSGYGIRDGNGVVFVSHLGAVYPSGFLPVEAGNVRKADLVDIYRNSEVFRQVRDVDRFNGKCGWCEYRRICGGSRARAYAHTGDLAGSDPICSYQPSALNNHAVA